MKKYLLLLFTILLLHINKSQAQYVTIPDTNFVNWLNANGYASCMNGNMMDTTCGPVVNATSVDCNGAGTPKIMDLTGIQFFDNLQDLDCSENFMSTLPPLPNTLKKLICYDDFLQLLPILPSTLVELHCGVNQLITIPNLPLSLKSFNCNSNYLTKLPSLPVGLKIVNCAYNPLDSLSSLPNNLLELHCQSTTLVFLPFLPNTLNFLNCSNNQLTSLPTLPSSLTYIYCDNNQLTNLPALSNSLTYLNCTDNLLTSLPALPNFLNSLLCFNNPNLYCLPKLNTIVNFNFTNTGIQCIPNYGNVTNSNPLLSSLPLCDTGNTNGCVPYWNISGRVYQDTIANCSAEVNEPKYSLIKLNLYKNSLLEQTTYSNFDGNYAFNTDTGLYTITIDTVSKPFVVTCPMAFSDSALISGNDTMRYNKNFALECKPGFDVGTTTVVRDSGIFLPANFANIKILAGDISNHYGLHCAAGTSGAVQIIITGPATYISTVNGALTPSVNGDTLIYTIADFGLVDFDNDFQIQVQTDTLAQMGQQVCFEVNVTPTIGDNNPANNTLTHCFTVVNSYDPNLKSVYPIERIENADGKLTYTIQFQNTGNAPAQHIYVMDTLDAALDASTFELLAYSRQPQVQLIGNNLRFNFPNINLPDSTNDEPNSHGYVQFSIKLKDSLPLGTTINNTSFIYFDFNPPVQTNTVTDTLTDCDNLVANIYINKKQLCKNEVLQGELELNYSYNSIKWYIDNVLSASGDSVSISNIGLGVHVLKTVIKTDYCLVKLFDTITVNDLPQPMLGNDTTLCGSLVIDAGAGFANYTWSNGATSQTIEATSSATYTVTVTDGNGCQASDVIVAAINPLPQIIFNALPMDSLCNSASLQNINPPSPLGGTLTGNGLSGLTFDPSVVALGFAYFTYVYTDSNSCTNSALDSVWVDACLGMNTFDSENYFTVAPNPTNDIITITLKQAGSNCTAALYDMMGKELKTQTMHASKAQMSLQDLSVGNYLLKVFDGGNLVGVMRVVKR